MNNPWIFRILIFSVLVTLAKIAPGLVWLISIACLGYVGFVLFKHYQASKSGNAPQVAPIHETNDRKKAAFVAYDSWEEIAAKLNSKVIGQKSACDQVAETIYNRMHVVRTGKPFAVYCLAGPAGTGKTYFAKILNEVLFDRESTLLHVDMTQYSNDGQEIALFGASRGMGVDTGILLDHIAGNPRSIILLDEFEKASRKAHARFLTAWSEGYIIHPITNAKVSTSDTIFILTTNAASEVIGEIADTNKDKPEECKHAICNTLHGSGFSRELLSRMDDIIPFLPLRGLDIARLCARKLDTYIQEQGRCLADGGVDPNVLLNAMGRYEKPGGSGREFVAKIENDIDKEIASGRIPPNSTVALRNSDGTIKIDVIQ